MRQEGRPVPTHLLKPPWPLCLGHKMMESSLYSIKCSGAQSCLNLFDSTDCSPPGSPSMGFPRQEYWSGLPFPSPLYHILSSTYKWYHIFVLSDSVIMFRSIHVATRESFFILFHTNLSLNSTLYHEELLCSLTIVVYTPGAHLSFKQVFSEHLLWATTNTLSGLEELSVE